MADQTGISQFCQPSVKPGKIPLNGVIHIKPREQRHRRQRTIGKRRKDLWHRFGEDVGLS
jgi:hypothetical protein